MAVIKCKMCGGDMTIGQCDVSDWTDIKLLATINDGVGQQGA